MVESSKYVKAWRTKVSQISKLTHRGGPLEGPIRLEVEFVMPRTKAMRDKPSPPMIQSPDTDKCVRAISDALSGIVFVDDRQITTIIAGKRRANPGELAGAKIRISNDENAGHVL